MYAELLQEEIVRSKAFAAENFGSAVGDEFSEMSREVASTKDIASRLVLTYAMSPLFAKALIEMIKATKDGGEADYLGAIKQNFMLFEPSLSLFYWGVQIGRKLGREQAELERSLGETK